MHYVLDEKGNKIEGLSKEEILAVLQQAINDGSLAGIDKDSAFVSKLKCCVGGDTHRVAFIPQAKYNELKTNNQLIANTLYFITDDTTAESFEESIEANKTGIEELEEEIGFRERKFLLWQNEDGVDVVNDEYGTSLNLGQNLAYTKLKLVLGTGKVQPKFELVYYCGGSGTSASMLVDHLYQDSETLTLCLLHCIASNETLTLFSNYRDIPAMSLNTSRGCLKVFKIYKVFE